MESNPKISFFELSPVLTVYLLGFFVFRGLFTNFPIYIQITQKLSDVETVEIWAVISGVALLVGAITRLPAGLLSDRIGRLKSLVIAYTLYIVALLLILLLSLNFVYIIAMSIIRFGLNSIAMSGRAIVSTADRDRALKNGLLSSAVGLGGFVGPYLMGYILDNYDPSTFIVVTIIIVLADSILFIILMAIVDKILRRKSITPDLSYSKISRMDKVNYIEALTTPGVKRMFFLFLTAGMGYGLISSIYSIYGYNILGYSPTIIGLVTGIGSLVQMIWAPVTGRLYEYIEDKYLRLIAWSLFLIAGIVATLSMFGGVFFVLSFILLNFANSTYFPMEITRMSKIIEKDQFSFIFGIATSLIILGTSIAGFISPFLFGILPEANFLTTAILGFFALIIILVTD